VRMRLCLAACWLTLPGWGQSVPQAVEKRYNRLRSMQVEFEESVSQGGRGRRQESGTLYLLRPSRMRWDYSRPAGKLFVSDGKMFYLYSPNSNQVQRFKPREIADWRAPLAFLLGRLDFHKEFGRLTVASVAEGFRLTAEPRRAEEPFSEAVFTIAAGTFEIRRIAVSGQDGWLTEFRFSGEKANPALQPRLFRFQAPAGAEVVE